MKAIQKKFVYKPNLVESIKNTVAKVLKTEVLSVKRILQGEISYAFRVQTQQGTVLAKVLKFKDWPNVKALIKVSGLLKKHKIAHPEIIFYSNKIANFPNGFLIQNYIEGTNCRKAILDGRISFAKYHYLIGKLLREVHHVKLERFGRLTKPFPKNTNYFDNRFAYLAKHLNEFNGTKLLPNNTQSILEEKVKLLLARIPLKFFPVLTHGDATPDNCILTPEGKLVLIDWDNSEASIWLEDFAWLTYCGSHMSSMGSLGTRAKVIKREFFKGYGKAKASLKEINKLELILHLFKAASLLGYHYYHQQDKQGFQRDVKRLKELLKK